MTDMDLKEQGNRLFCARKYDEAVGCYSKAIVSISACSQTRLHTILADVSGSITHDTVIVCKGDD